MADKDYEQWEESCKKIRIENKVILNDFEKWLQEKNISEKTIRRHVQNADFYINHFLLYEDAVEAKDGAGQIGLFLGYWFIRKAMWASGSTVKSSAASLKKFYSFLNERGLVEKEAVQFLNVTIKNEIKDWMIKADKY